MQQSEIVTLLRIHLSNKQIDKFTTTRSRLKKGYYCYVFNRYLHRAKNELILQLGYLINDDYIDLEALRDLGLYETIRMNSIQYYPSIHDFSKIVKGKYSVKEKVIDNMLYAIILIDYSINFKE